MELVRYRIVGLKPLLMNNGESLTFTFKKGMTPEQEVKPRLWVLANGQLYIPAAAFRKGICKVAFGAKVKGMLLSVILKGGVLYRDADSYCGLIHPTTGKPIKKYTIDSRRVVIKGAAIIRHRPRIEEWACILTLQIDTDLLEIDVVTTKLQSSGQLLGAGDYRLEKMGTFGKYSAALMEGKVK